VRFRVRRERAAWIRPSEARVCGNPACESWFESPNQKRLFCSDRCRLQVFYECRRPAEDAVAL